jgi:hypothetical protein
MIFIETVTDPPFGTFLGPTKSGPDLFVAGEKLLEAGIVADRIPDRIDLQLLNRNIKADRERK